MPLLDANMTNEIQRLQADITDHTVAVSALLQKALVLATQLGDQESMAWARRELNGYHKGDQELEYRCLKGEYVVLTAEGRRLPIHWTSASDMNRRFITLPLPEVESLMGPDYSTFAVKVQIDPQSLTSLDLQPGDCLAFQVGRATVAGLLHAVRNRILDWTLGVAPRMTPGKVDHDLPVADRRKTGLTEES